MNNTFTAAGVLAGGAERLLDFGRLDLARVLAELAVTEDRKCANGHSVLSAVYDEATEWPMGLEHPRRAVASLPASPQLKYNLAVSTLRLDDYRAGLSLMEARIDKADWTGLAVAPRRAAERHRLLQPGDSVDGPHVLVITEQGLGDCLMFARYLPLLAQCGAYVAVACSPPLRPLFARIAGVDKLLSPPPEQPLAKINLSQAEFDVWLPLLSLPFYFGTEFTTVPTEVPYLNIDRHRIVEWRQYYKHVGRPNAPKVGLVFQPNPASASAVDRSIPVQDLTPLFRLANIDLINLQRLDRHLDGARHKADRREVGANARPEPARRAISMAIANPTSSFRNTKGPVDIGLMNGHHPDRRDPRPKPRPELARPRRLRAWRA